MDWFDAAAIAAIIAAFGSFAAFILDRNLAALERKREKAAEVLSEALLWVEMPYRVARRPNDDPDTLSALSATLHRLQERYIFDRAWLQVEVPEGYAAYSDLLAAIKGQCMGYIQDAWKRQPVSEAAGMNLGPIYPVDVGSEVEDYVVAIRQALRPWWKVWP